MKCTQVAKVKTQGIIIIIQAVWFPIPKYGVFYSFDHNRYQWYESEDLPRFWTKVVSIERKTTKIRLCTKKSTFIY